MSHEWRHLVEYRAKNGRSEFVDLCEAIASSRGPNRTMLSYPNDTDRRIDVNRSSVPIHHGVRPTVELDFELSDLAEIDVVSKLRNRLLDRDRWTVLLSLDGGVTMRPVVITSQSGPRSLAGKTFVGAAFSVRMEAVDLLPAIPDMLDDELQALELLPDGGFESWASATALNSWGKTTPGASAINRDAATFYAGTYACRFNPDSGNLPLITTIAGLMLKPGRWYDLAMVVNSGYVDGSKIVDVRIVHRSTGRALQTNLYSWAIDTNYAWAPTVPNNAWTARATQFQADRSAQEGDLYDVSIRGNNATSGDPLWVDSASLRGPVVPGVLGARW